MAYYMPELVLFLIMVCGSENVRWVNDYWW